MARTKIVVQYDCEFEQVQNTINNILSSNGFREITINTGENVWKKGTGLATAMHFIKVEYKTGAIVLSGWIQIGVGSVGGKEQELKGFVGMAPKKSVLKTMKKLQDIIQNT